MGLFQRVIVMSIQHSATQQLDFVFIVNTTLRVIIVTVVFLVIMVMQLKDLWMIVNSVDALDLIQRRPSAQHVSCGLMVKSNALLVNKVTEDCFVILVQLGFMEIPSEVRDALIVLAMGTLTLVIRQAVTGLLVSA